MVGSLYETNVYGDTCNPSDLVLVLDMDHTLLSTYDDFSLLQNSGIKTLPEDVDIRSRLYVLEIKEYNGKKGSGKTTKWWGLLRPGLREFLIYAFSKFKHVVLWSAGEYDYVHAACRKMFTYLRNPDLILTREDCEYDRDGNPTKPLTKLINHPKLSRNFDLSKIVIVDDRDYTFLPNPQNGILIPEYSPEEWSERMGIDGKKTAMRMEDYRLEQLINWFENLKTCDVRTVDKTRIFS